MSKPISIDGIRGDHLIRTTVSGQPGQLAISRRCRPECPCQRRKPTSPAD